MRIVVASALILILISLDVRAAEHGYGVEATTGQRTINDTLRVWQSGWALTGFKFEYFGHEDGVGFAGRNIKKILSVNPEALREVNTFAKYQVPTFFTTLVFGGTLGWGIGSKNGRLILIGVGGTVVSFIFDQIGYSHLKKAASIFNEGLE